MVGLRAPLSHPCPSAGRKDLCGLSSAVASPEGLKKEAQGRGGRADTPPLCTGDSRVTTKRSIRLKFFFFFLSPHSWLFS